VVVNVAAYTNVDKAEDEFDLALRANAVGPAVIGAACHSESLPLIHVSTDYVFDGTKACPYVERDPIAPICAYGRSKAAGEDRVRSVAPMHLIIRTAWVYGEFGNNFLKTILRLAKERDELRVVADQHGNPTSTGEIARAIISIAPRLRDKAGPWGTYHFAGSGITTWYGFAELIVAVQARYTNRKPAVVPIATSEYPTKAKRPANSALDCSLFAHTFGISPASWAEECERVTNALLSS
jgi:dTDP-4-dehydrorhamnose reductase